MAVVEAGPLRATLEVRRAFGRAAATYDGAAVLQREVGARLAGRLDVVKLAPGTIIDVGCGTGSLSAAILGQSAPRSVTGVDASEGFVAHAASKTDDPRVRFRRGDAQKLDVPAESATM